MMDQTETEIESLLREVLREIPVSSVQPFYDVEDWFFANQLGAEQTKSLVILWRLAWWRSTVCFDLRLEIQRRLRQTIDRASSVLDDVGYAATDLRHVSPNDLFAVLSALVDATTSAGVLKLEHWRSFCEKLSCQLPKKYQQGIANFNSYLNKKIRPFLRRSKNLVSTNPQTQAHPFVDELRKLNAVQFLTCKKARIKMVDRKCFDRVKLGLVVDKGQIKSNDTCPELVDLMNSKGCISMRQINKAIHGSLTHKHASADKEID